MGLRIRSATITVPATEEVRRGLAPAQAASRARVHKERRRGATGEPLWRLSVDFKDGTEDQVQQAAAAFLTALRPFVPAGSLPEHLHPSRTVNPRWVPPLAFAAVGVIILAAVGLGMIQNALQPGLTARDRPYLEAVHSDSDTTQALQEAGISDEDLVSLAHDQCDADPNYSQDVYAALGSVSAKLRDMGLGDAMAVHVGTVVLDDGMNAYCPPQG